MPTAFVIAFATLREGLPRQRFICSTNMTLQDPIDLLVNGGTPERCLGLCCFLLSSWAALWQPSVMSTTLKDAGAALTKPTSPVEDLISQTKRPGLCRAHPVTNSLRYLMSGLSCIGKPHLLLRWFCYRWFLDGALVKIAHKGSTMADQLSEARCWASGLLTNHT